MSPETSDRRPATAPRSARKPLGELWDEHVHNEFQAKNTSATLDTMLPDAYVNHVPVLTGGVGRAQLHDFYSKHFIRSCRPTPTSCPSPGPSGPTGSWTR